MQEMAGVETVGKVYREDYGDDYWRMTRDENALPYLTAAYPYITYYSEDDALRINELSTILEPHIRTETAKFITNARPLEEFELYLTELKDLGVEELLDYYTAAYETYLANMA